MSAEKKAIMKQLTCLLKENGTSILTDGVPLCLTVSFLRFLNDGFMTLSDDAFGASFEALPGNSVQVPLYHELQFLYDFVQKTPKLKLMQDSNPAQPVSVASLRSLRGLEIKRVPVAMVTGMSKLRGRLETLVCTRCLTSIEDILEHCGVDRSHGGATLVWTQLTTLCLCYNYIADLDNSLRLLPVLRILDVSHNTISDAECYLEHLTALEEADLGYNLLTSIPSFSLSCRNNLTRLCLRHNLLEHIEGIQELVGLIDLDLAHNCLMSHDFLQPLSILQRLTSLLLEGNPLSHHSKHRVLTMKHLNPLVAKQVILDRQPVSEQESMFAGHRFVTEVQRQLPRRPPQVDRGEPSHVTSDFMDSFDDSVSYNGNSLSCLQKTGMTFAEKMPRKKKGRTNRKARHVEISDIDDGTTGGDSPENMTPLEASSYSSNKYNVSFTEEQINKRKEIETMRNQLGPDWLQTLTAARESTNHITAEPESKPRTPERSNSPTFDVMDCSSDITEPTNDIKPVDSAPGKTRSQPFTKTPANSRVESTPESSDITSFTVGSTNVSDNSSDSPLIITLDSSENRADISESGALHSGINNRHSRPQEGHSEPREGRSDSKGSSGSDKGHSEPVFSWSRTDTTDVDYGPESEPFIVRRPDSDGNLGNHFLISVAERYLLEKDIEGAVTETFDQRCLRRCRVYGEGESADVKVSSSGLVCVRLSYDYYKKDKTERCYIMEDQQTAESLCELLEPALELREMAEALQDRLQCLKCNAEFSRSESKHLTHDMLSGGKWQCPKCKSDMIIELDVGQVARSVGQQGVMTIDPKSGKPECMLHEPTAQSTPIKGQSANRLLYGSPPHSGKLTQRSHSSNSLTSQDSPLSRSMPARSQGDCTARKSLLLPRDDHRPSGSVTATRQWSESSDIVVLDKRPSVSSISSDIAVLSGMSEMTLSAPALSPIYDSPISQMNDADLTNMTCQASAVCQVSELTPCGSLSNNARHSMVSSIYKNSIHGNDNSKEFFSVADDSGNPGNNISGNHSNHSFQSIPDPDNKTFHSITDTFVTNTTADSGQSVTSGDDLDPDLVRFCHTDYEFVDHRLKLYLTLEVIGGDEEIRYVFQCGIVEWTQATEYRGLLLVTNNKLYIFSIQYPLRAERISKGLRLKHAFILGSIQYISKGFSGQCFCIRTEKARFVCLVRDKARCKRFLKPFSDLVQERILASDSQLEGITSDRMTARNLVSEVLHGGDADTDVDTDICMFIMCHLQVAGMKTGSDALSAVSVVVTSSHVAMATEDHLYLLQTEEQTSRDGKQFELKDVQKLTDITAIELNRLSCDDVKVTFTDESTSEEYTWRLVMATSDTSQAFVSMVTKLWEDQFGVEFTVTYS